MGRSRPEKERSLLLMTFDAPIRRMSACLRCTPLRFALACAAASLLGLWIRSAVPVFAIAGAGEDDALFVRLARSLAEGHWLGPFDKLTLVKGMAYPLFIAASFWAGVPLKLAEQGVYLTACLAAASLLRRRMAPGSWTPAVAFVVLALDPVLWGADLARIIREGLYIGLTLAIVALSAAVSFPTGRGRAGPLGVGLLLGLLGGAFWLTREEGPWLLPAVAVNVGLGGIAAWRARDRHAAARAAVGWIAAAAVSAALVLGVARVNEAHYGAFEANEVQSLPFRRAYGALARIRQAAPRRWVVLPRDAREAAYAASPAARELAPVLDGPLGEERRRSGCAEVEVTDCPEILAGWFQWALRDAVAGAGHYGSAAEAAAFYTRLADEIDAACARGALSCLPPRATLVPPFRGEDVARALRTFPRLARILMGMGADTVGAPPSVGDPQALAAMADMVGPIAPSLAGPTTVRGWAAAPGGAPELRAAPQGEASIALAPAPDVAQVHPDLGAVRFTLEASNREGDTLVVGRPERGGVDLSMGALVAGATIEAGGATVHVDTRTDTTAVGQRRRDVILGMARRIAAIYAAAVPFASLLACLGLMGAWGWRSSAPATPAVVALALSSATGVLCRLALLSYLDATAIPSVNGLYPSPASPLLLLFAVLGCGLGGRALLARLRRRSTDL